jgi:hypothetical protein
MIFLVVTTLTHDTETARLTLLLQGLLGDVDAFERLGGDVDADRLAGVFGD